MSRSFRRESSVPQPGDHAPVSVVKERYSTPSRRIAKKTAFLLPSVIFILLLPWCVSVILGADATNFLASGKESLDKGDYESAAVLLTRAYEQLPLLGDYALLWRAKAYASRGDIERALADLKTVKEKYPDSPLMKKLRRKEIELRQRNNDPLFVQLVRDFVRDFPSETDMKYLYAQLLKKNHEKETATKIFKEIFVSVSPLSKGALGELSPSDVTAEDMMKRGKNLNAAWLFKDAEECFREALRKNSGELRSEILEGLAYSLFNQKRYKESAELYKKIHSLYWRSRSLLRAGDMKTFESELQALMKSSDKRIAEVLVNYGSRKRREGDSKEALRIFAHVMARHPSAKEEALWATAWTYFLSREYEKAYTTFSRLYETFGDSRYLYWKVRSSDITGRSKKQGEQLYKNGVNYRDFYAFLSILRDDKRVPPVITSARKPLSVPFSERVDILTTLGLTAEATEELLYRSKRPNTSPDELVYISSYLNKLGDYRAALSLLGRVPYAESLHELFYPLAYAMEVEKAAEQNGIDPLLILSVIREESRFGHDARSIAGACGLMQLMPRTADKLCKSMNIPLVAPQKLYDAETNILLGARYLRNLLKTYNSIPEALAAYNAGENIVNNWLNNATYISVDEFIEDIPYRETRNYVKRVMTTYFEYLRASQGVDVQRIRSDLGNF